MKKAFILFLIILPSSYVQNHNYNIDYELSNGCGFRDTISVDYVPNEETAKKIAEAIWIPIYGESHILKQRPYSAELVNDIWIVKGLIPEPYRYDPNIRGGTAYIEIRKKDCKILKVTHYK